MRNRIFYVCRFTLGVFFVISAILKFISVGSFESYIFSFGFLSLTLSSWLARFVLLAESLVGLLLIFGIYKKQVERGCFLLLLCFSIFLLYLIAIGETGNCHCMGETFDLPPFPSLCKNLLLLLLLYFASQCKPFSIKHSSLVACVIVLATLIFSFVKLPIGIVSPKPSKYNPTAYEALVQKRPELQTLQTNNRAMVCFFSVKCKHCKMAMRKLEVILNQTQFSTVQWVVWGSEEELEKFREETGVADRPHFFLSPTEMMPITDFHVPLLLFLEKGEVKALMSNSTFDDELTRKLLQQ